MKSLLDSYAQRLYQSGLVEPGEAILGMADADLVWNTKDDACRVLAPLFEELNINALVFARPAEPYRTIIDHLAASAPDGVIRPKDCETLTFLHDLPVANRFSIKTLIPLLSRLKCAIIPGAGIMAHGSISIEQPFITFSSVCFACFVKFFSDLLHEAKSGGLSSRSRRALETVVDILPAPSASVGRLASGPFQTEDQVRAAMSEAGKKMVSLQLVDSTFGNISYCHDNILYISQTGSFLDDLENCIDPCPTDNTSCTPITASSELTAHLQIVGQTGCRAVLHGHPRFSVILSMDCDLSDCPGRNQCHRACPEKRDVCAVPVVPGEVGAGPYGLCRTVPNAVAGSSAAIVYGHGVFTIDLVDFNGALDKLIDIETRCRIEYFNRLERTSRHGI